MTIVIRPPIRLETLNALPLLGALAIAGSVNEMLRRTAYVRWPNDVVVKDGRKLAGVLSDARFRGNELEYVVLGLGINANFRTSMVSEIHSNPTTLLDIFGSPVERERLACLVLFEVEKLYRRMEASRGFNVLKQLEKLDWSRGKSVKISLSDETIVGVMDGYDNMSCVRVRVHDSIRIVETSSTLSVEYA
jgi:BirA family biotin operon repressor/biotin-[acetyl-CoA-carboxylase] ligase